jgi:two-component system KDP operon response regulator KdpE
MNEARMNEAGPKLLAIEDDVQIQRFLAAALEAHGYELLVAGTGAEGLRLAAARQPDIVLVDLGLPDRCDPRVARVVQGRGHRAFRARPGIGQGRSAR